MTFSVLKQQISESRVKSSSIYLWILYGFWFQDFSDINQDDPNAVVVGLAPEKFNHQYLTKAFCLIKEKKAPLIAIHKGWGNLRSYFQFGPMLNKMNQITVPKPIILKLKSYSSNRIKKTKNEYFNIVCQNLNSQ